MTIVSQEDLNSKAFLDYLERNAKKIRDLENRINQLEAVAKVPYKIGTWTPTLIGLGTAGTFSYGGATAGTYTRLGNTVFLRGRITIQSVSVAPTGSLTIQGLPIPASSSIAGGVQFYYWSNIALGGGANVALGGSIVNSTINLYVSNNIGGGAVMLTGSVAAVAASTDLVFAGQYHVS